MNYDKIKSIEATKHYKLLNKKNQENTNFILNPKNRKFID